MTRIANHLICGALAASLACAGAAQAKPAKGSGSNLKSKCTVAAVVLGTGWDIFGGNSSCSMLSEKETAQSNTDRSRQSALPMKSKK